MGISLRRISWMRYFPEENSKSEIRNQKGGGAVRALFELFLEGGELGFEVGDFLAEEG